VRTAGGKRKGRLSGIHATNLGAISLNALVDRSSIEASIVEDVIMGCVTQAGEQSNHVGRNCVLASNFPDSVLACRLTTSICSRSTKRSRRYRWHGSNILTLIHTLRTRKLRYGLQTMCEGGGLANVTIIEAL
jgi:acetyl-CoA acetyltransferase